MPAAESGYITVLDSLDAISNIFWGTADIQCRALIEGSFNAVFEEVDRLSRNNLTDKLKTFLKGFDNSEDLLKHLNEEYVSLFISNINGITAPLFESCYEFENAPLMGPAAEKMKARLEAIGLDMTEDINEPEDHICIEIEYLYFVLKNSLEDEDSGSLKMAEDFVSNVMLPWTAEFCKRLNDGHPDSFYAIAAGLLVDTLGAVKQLGH